MKHRSVSQKAIPGPVLYPCLAAAALILFSGLENMLWRTGDSYPVELAQVRYVDDIRLLTPQAMRYICNLPLTTPELLKKQNGLYLRCGTPGLEGMYRIEHSGR